LEKVLNKNPDIFGYNLLENEFFIVVNPLISNGMKILNVIQKKVLDEIDGEKTLGYIAKVCNLLESDIENIITQLKQKDFVSETNSFKHFSENKDPKSINVWVHTTNSCNIACTYCNINKDISHMQDDIYEKFYEKILQTTKLRGLKKVTLRLAGGEPTTRFSYFKDFLERLHEELAKLDCKLVIVFLTNLVILTDEMIEFIKKYKCSTTVSLDGLKNFNDANRIYSNGKGTFNKVEFNLNRLLENKLPVFVNITVTNQNLDGMLDLTKYLVNKNIGFRYSFVKGVYLDQFKLSLVLKDCYDYIEDNLDIYPNFTAKHRLTDLHFDHPSNQACSSGMTNFLLNTDGQMHYCHVPLDQNKPIGSLEKKEDLLTQVMSQKEFNFTNSCDSCSYRYICSGGCPFDKIAGKSPFCDVFHQFIPVVFRLQAKERILKIMGIENYKRLFQK
jgi:uncharacterized protein